MFMLINNYKNEKHYNIKHCSHTEEKLKYRNNAYDKNYILNILRLIIGQFDQLLNPTTQDRNRIEHKFIMSYVCKQKFH